jgi:hypothetical protein
MKELRGDLLKSERLKRTRGTSFEELLRSRLIAVKRHLKRPHQYVLLFEHRGYIWVVPCVVSEDEVFLKTLFPSRNYTKLYKRGEL